MTNLNPFLLFDGNCAEAMTFYQSCLGGDLSVTRVADTPMANAMPPEKQQKVAYSSLKIGALELSATDWMHPVQKPKQGNTVAIYLVAKDKELRPIFDRLAVGAHEELLEQLREMPFGTYGHLADKYGVHWFFRGERDE